MDNDDNYSGKSSVKEVEVSSHHNGLKVGDRVQVFDRYRYALPLEGVITKLSNSNDGVEVKLTTSHPPEKHVGKLEWFHAQQLVRLKATGFEMLDASPSSSVPLKEILRVTASGGVPSVVSAKAKEKIFSLVEVYDSMKGEGTQAGIPMTFVRFSKCNLDCSFCDTPYNRVAIKMSHDELVTLLVRMAPAWIIFTGGEPCLQLTSELLVSLRVRIPGVKFAIETNGTVWNEAVAGINYINISPKKGYPVHPSFSSLPVDEIRYLIDGPQDDIYDVGVTPKAITISPMMSDPVPLTTSWKSGEGHPSLTGVIDQASFNRCAYLVHKYRHRGARLSVQVHKFVGVR